MGKRKAIGHKSILSLQAHFVFAWLGSRPYSSKWMELQKIKQLIDVLVASDLSELELIEGDHRVRLVRRPTAAATSVERAHPTVQLGGHGPEANLLTPTETDLLLAPLYGILHLTPSPGEPAFVQPGDTVTAGQTLCMIEAMKMFHEVKASRTALVAAILARTGEEVQVGAALFRFQAIEPQ